MMIRRLRLHREDQRGRQQHEAGRRDDAFQLHFIAASFFLFRSAMPPPAKKFKASGGGGSGSGTPSPATPSSAPATPTPVDEPAQKRPRRGKTAKEVLPTTPLTRGRDSQEKLKKYKTQCDSLALTLRSLPYTENLVKDMEKYGIQFELLGLQAF